MPRKPAEGLPDTTTSDIRAVEFTSSSDGDSPVLPELLDQIPSGQEIGTVAGQTAVLQRANSFRDKFERYISQDRHNPHLRRKAYTAVAAKMARTIHAVVKYGEPYRPFFEGASPGGRTPLCKGRGGA